MISDGKILLTGATGQVGSELLKTLSSSEGIVAPKRAEMDLADEASVREFVRAVRPRWIVNPGAYTAVDKAEDEPDAAYAINRDAVRVLGEEAKRLGAAVVHFSTDYVFDGSLDRPYREDDPTGPVSVYGSSKLAGELALADTGAAHLIFRISWVYGATGKNFLRSILRFAAEKDKVRVVADQFGSPTWSRDIARMTAAVMYSCERDAAGGNLSDRVQHVGGVYHATGAGETTWHGFAAAAVQGMKMCQPERRWAEIEAITTAEFPTRAKRPANSRLYCGKLSERFGWKMMDWRDSLAQVLPEITEG